MDYKLEESSCRERGIFARDRKSIDGKLDSMVKRQLYTTFKTAPTEEEREKARQLLMEMLELKFLKSKWKNYSKLLIYLRRNARI